MQLEKILHVEDDESIRIIVEMALVDLSGYTLCACESGAEAIVQAEQFAPDLILLDAMMPGMDGFALARAIRADACPARAQVPIIALTASVMESTREACRAAGIDHFLAKPVEPHALRALLAALLVPDSVGQ